MTEPNGTVVSPDEGGGDESRPLLQPDGSSTKITKASYFYVYLSHFLSAWGSRMWQFGVGILLVYITPNSLQLTAVFGLTEGITVLLLGPLVGDWIDKSPRLRAAQITLVGRDFFVLLCAAVIFCFLEYKETIEAVGDWTHYVAYALIIGLSSCGFLLSVGNAITIERDWIVEICASDEEKLATMTATMRGIDLTTQILAPIVTGQVMTYVGVANGALFIAGWNLVSLIFEYFLIMKVYHSVPALRKEKEISQTVRNKSKSNPTSAENKVENNELPFAEDNHKSITESIQDENESSKCGGCTGWRIFSGFTIIIEGWKTFVSYEVMMSGLSLAMLYMTVLGFDNVTVGYAKIQGLSESTLGIMMGGAGLLGIIGSAAYPFVRRCIGLPRTGMLALTFQIFCLAACLVSIVLPGSPFELVNSNSTQYNCTTAATQNPARNENCPLTAVIVLMGGIIGARLGLWMADLSITQMFMMTVKEQDRGVVFGVQNSINKMMDMIKYGLVVALPFAPQFGYLVIISFSFIVGGYIMYIAFFCRLSPYSSVREKKRYQKL